MSADDQQPPDPMAALQQLANEIQRLKAENGELHAVRNHFFAMIKTLGKVFIPTMAINGIVKDIDQFRFDYSQPGLCVITHFRKEPETEPKINSPGGNA